jgi:hypothetical protein
MKKFRDPFKFIFGSLACFSIILFNYLSFKLTLQDIDPILNILAFCLRLQKNIKKLKNKYKNMFLFVYI